MELFSGGRVSKKIAIGLIGLNSKQEIARCLDPWMGHIDTAILGDGKFDNYPGESDYSQDGWLEYAEKRYQDKCELVTYKYAGPQSEKRQKYLDIAGELKCDFLITVDTEEFIDPDYRDWKLFYKQLYHLSEGTDDRIFYQWIWIPDERLWPKQGNNFPSCTWLHSMKIHKDPGTMRYALGGHFGWCDKWVTDDEIIKWDMENQGKAVNEQTQNPYIYTAKNTIDGVRVNMDRTLRSPEQIRLSHEWALKNAEEEKAQIYYAWLDLKGGISPPAGCKTWKEFGKRPHSFDKYGRRIELII